MTLSQIYFKLLRWGIFISLFLPLVIFSQYLSPFHFGKMIIFRTLVEIMAVFYILLIIAEKKYRPKWTLILISFSVFAFLYFFTGLTGINFYSSFWGSIERMGGIFNFVHYWVYFLILISIIKTQIDWERILKLSVGIGFLSILFAHGQHLVQSSVSLQQSWLARFFVGWQHGERVIGTIGNPSLFAGYLIFVLFLAIFFLLRNVALWQKGFFAAVFILGTPILLMTASRGSIISFFFTLFLMGLFFAFKSQNRRIRKYIIIVLALFILFVIIFGLSKNKAWVQNTSWLSRISNISINASTIQTRLWSWKSAIEGFKERPILGWGPENFTFLHMKYFDPRHFSGIGSETIWDRAHNIILEMLTTMGIIGLLSYLFIFVVIFYLLIAKLKEKKISRADFGVISAMLIAYFGQNLFIFDTFANYFLFFLIAGYINHLDDKNQDLFVKDGDTALRKEPSIVGTSILLIIALVFAFKFNIQPARANFACTRGILTGKSGNAQKAFNYYKKALDYKVPQGAYDIRHKLALFAIQVVETQRAKNRGIDTNLLHYAIDVVEKNIDAYPQDTTPYLYIARMYILMIDKEPETAGALAEQYVNKALNINKKNPRIWYELGQAQLSLKKYEESYSSFKQALDLNPNVAISYWFLGMAAVETGRNNPERYQEASGYVEKAIALGYDYKNSLNDLMRLVNLYDKVKNYQKVVEMYELAIIEAPDKAQLYASLAAAYAKIGNYQSAIKAARKSAEIDPNFKEEAEKFIKSLPIK
jgi:O-antigen ligase/Tfp pilus assembly protein PilF